MGHLSSFIHDIKSLPKNLIFIYLTVLLMRSSFYLSLSILEHPAYLQTTGFEKSLIFTAYPLTELLTVSFFGAISDRIGRKPIFMSSFVFSGIAILLFGFIRDIAILPFISGIYGLGAAAQVTSSLSMVADSTEDHEHGEAMGVYDAMTLVGLGLGFGTGFLIMTFIPRIGHIMFFVGFFILLVLGVFAYFRINETFTKEEIEKLAAEGHKGIFTNIKEVLSDKDVQFLLPIWIPIICLYGIVLTFASTLAEDIDLTSGGFLELLVLGLAFGAIFIGFPIHGRLSDKYGRKLFLLIGMFSFAAFVTLLIFGTEANMLVTLAPLLIIVGFGCGAFPPAALALLADISEKGNTGTTMGSYSVVYGIGLIFGPLLQGLLYDGKIPVIRDFVVGSSSVVLLVWVLALISIIGTLLLPARLDKKRSYSAN